jgi:RNA polymerase sigma-70 factor (ECF subfamily)
MDSVLFCLMAALIDEEGDLANRLKLHDPQALADLYDLYGRIAFVLIARIVHNSAIAEDLVQESFLRVWNRAEQLNAERGSVGPWLVSVCRHCALDYLKSSEAHLCAHCSSGEIDFPTVTMDEGLLNSERARDLRTALEQLSDSQRKVIELAYYEGLSQSEIASRLHQPLGTIKSWTRSALHILREQLHEKPVAYI